LSYATEKQSRRRFLGLGVLGAAGFLGAGAAAPGGGEDHNLLSATHPDTDVASPEAGDLITGAGSPAKWTRFDGGGGWLRGNVVALDWKEHTLNGLDPDIGHPDVFIPFQPSTQRVLVWDTSIDQWTPFPGYVNLEDYDTTDVPLTATGDSQATLQKISQGNVAIPEWYLVISGPNNALISITGDIHRQVLTTHTVIGSFVFQFPPTGAGDIFKTSTTIHALDTSPPPVGTGTRGYHLNITAITLGAGTITIQDRTLRLMAG